MPRKVIDKIAVGAKNTYNSLNSNTLIQTVLCVALVILIGLLVASSLQLWNRGKEPFADAPYHLVYVYSERCPHCVQFGPEFHRFQTELAPSLTAPLRITEVESKDPDARPYVSMPQVIGFPCLLLFAPDGSFVKERVGGSSAEGVKTFVQTHASSSTSAPSGA
jgi:thiol-disulfide isomerase/thioredoxin